MGAKKESQYCMKQTEYKSLRSMYIAAVISPFSLNCKCTEWSSLFEKNLSKVLPISSTIESECKRKLYEPDEMKSSTKYFLWFICIGYICACMKLPASTLAIYCAVYKKSSRKY